MQQYKLQQQPKIEQLMSSEATAGSCSGVDTEDDKSSTPWSAVIALVGGGAGPLKYGKWLRSLTFFRNIKTIFSLSFLPEGDFVNYGAKSDKNKQKTKTQISAANLNRF